MPLPAAIKKMDESKRRFLQSAAMFGASLLLPASAVATEASGDKRESEQLIEEQENRLNKLATAPPVQLTATEDNILGPYYRQGSPYRAKVTSIGEPGTPLLVKGKVWSLNTRKPLPGAIIEIWQADDKGRYDNDDPEHPPTADSFTNRTRMTTDETGRYEFESIHPGKYRIGESLWRPSHVHYMVSAPGHKTLVTQLYFHGDPHNEKDQFVKQSLIRTPKKESSNGVSYELIAFDIVLAGTANR